jgi:hypothetical protein
LKKAKHRARFLPQDTPGEFLKKVEIDRIFLSRRTS